MNTKHEQNEKMKIFETGKKTKICKYNIFSHITQLKEIIIEKKMKTIKIKMIKIQFSTKM